LSNRSPFIVANVCVCGQVRERFGPGAAKSSTEGEAEDQPEDDPPHAHVPY
jgi:hypothetical protein